MRWLLSLLFITLSTASAHGWGRVGHRLLAEESLKPVAKEWGLEKPIPVTPFSSFQSKLSKEKPEIQTREDFAQWLRVNPASSFDQPRKEEKIDDITTPLKILSRYAHAPDDGRDKDLPYDTLEQFWYGAGAKASSQAFRHMEKTPFDLLHPLNTFGFPLGTIGQASERAQIYFDLALEASRLGEPYWAWNFLGCSLHYIEDLQQPYHATQLSPAFLWNGLMAYFNWGQRDGKDLLQTITHVASNSHHFFEDYVDYNLLLPNQPAKTKDVLSMGQLWLAALRKKDLLAHPASIQILAKNIRNFSNRHAFETIEATFELTGKSLKGPKVYEVSEGDEPFSEDPTLYLNPEGERRMEATSKISQIVLDNFSYQGMAIRTVVHSFMSKAGDKGES